MSSVPSIRYFNDGPAIPIELICALETGKLTFFCGAGISCDLGTSLKKPELGSFSSLFLAVAKKHSWNHSDDFKRIIRENERDRINYIHKNLTISPAFVSALRYKFDDAFEQLSLELKQYTDNNKTITKQELRDTLRGILTISESHKQAKLDNHQTLLTLSKPHGNKDMRLITTNFDNAFELAAVKKKIKLNIHTASALPIPDETWNSLVYLHGQASNASSSLVYDSASFGKAYITEGWAARFLATLFSDPDQYIIFIGYSLNDPLMRYLMSAISASNRHDNLYILTDDCNTTWKKEFHIEPLHYKKDCHEYLWQTLSHLADLHSQTDGRLNLSLNYLSRKPDESLPEDKANCLALLASDLAKKQTNECKFSENLFKSLSDDLEHTEDDKQKEIKISVLVAWFEYFYAERNNTITPLYPEKPSIYLNNDLQWGTLFASHLQSKPLHPASQLLGTFIARFCLNDTKIIKLVIAMGAHIHNNQYAIFEIKLTSLEIYEKLQPDAKKFWSIVLFYNNKRVPHNSPSHHIRHKYANDDAYSLMILAELDPVVRFESVSGENIVYKITTSVDQWARELLISAAEQLSYKKIHLLSAVLDKILYLEHFLDSKPCEKDFYGNTIISEDYKQEVDAYSLVVHLLWKALLGIKNEDLPLAKATALKWLHSDIVTYNRLALVFHEKTGLLPSGKVLGFILNSNTLNKNYFHAEYCLLFKAAFNTLNTSTPRLKKTHYEKLFNHIENNQFDYKDAYLDALTVSGQIEYATCRTWIGDTPVYTQEDFNNKTNAEVIHILSEMSTDRTFDFDNGPLSLKSNWEALLYPEQENISLFSIRLPKIPEILLGLNNNKHWAWRSLFDEIQGVRFEHWEILKCCIKNYFENISHSDTGLFIEASRWLIKLLNVIEAPEWYHLWTLVVNAALRCLTPQVTTNNGINGRLDPLTDALNDPMGILTQALYLYCRKITLSPADGIPDYVKQDFKRLAAQNISLTPYVWFGMEYNYFSFLDEHFAEEEFSLLFNIESSSVENTYFVYGFIRSLASQLYVESFLFFKPKLLSLFNLSVWNTVFSAAQSSGYNGEFRNLFLDTMVYIALHWPKHLTKQEFSSVLRSDELKNEWEHLAWFLWASFWNRVAPDSKIEVWNSRLKPFLNTYWKANMIVQDSDTPYFFLRIILTAESAFSIVAKYFLDKRFLLPTNDFERLIPEVLKDDYIGTEENAKLLISIINATKPDGLTLDDSDTTKLTQLRAQLTEKYPNIELFNC
jgi:NAD-dependent SIR2 family protein deacetylase